MSSAVNDSPVKEVTINTYNSLEKSSDIETTNNVQNDSLNKGDIGSCENSPKKCISESRTIPNEYFTKFMVSLIDLFKKDRSLLQKRGPFIIRLVILS